MKTEFILQAIQAVNEAIISHESEIESLDREIGDGDHYINIRRGASAIADMQTELADLTPDAALNRIGMKLLSTIGGAAGPLFGSFFMGMAKSVKEQGAETLPQIATAFAAGVEAIKNRGKANLGEKTMLDTLIPVAETFSRLTAQDAKPVEIFAGLKQAALDGMQSTMDMVATRGRAAGLGERSVGHIDAGAKSSQVMINAVCDLALNQN
jgi:dihydroxyacetone kinase-like protein